MMQEVASEVVDLVAEFDGVNSSEHGDGRIRSPFNPRIFGDELYGAMREVKRLFDPDGRVQPGRDGRRRAAARSHIRDAEYPQPKPLDDPLRLPRGPHARRRRPLPADRRLPQDRQRRDVPVLHGHARGGARHPRPRQRARQGAVSEPDPAAALGDERLHEILDLCLECKACKSECPLSVDMATLKSEFLSQYNAIHGTPLRSRLFGSIRTLNRSDAATAPLSNLPVPRRLMEKVAGIDRRRPLPRFERETLIKLGDRRRRGGRPRPRHSRGEVVFLADSFTTFTEPGVGPGGDRAARRRGLRRAAGERRLLRARERSPRACSTMPRAKAEALTERLQGTAMVTGVEPSCLLTLREEHVQLIGDRGVASRTKLVEELLVDGDRRRRAAAEGPRPAPHPVPRPLPPEGARRAPPRPSRCCERIPGAEVVELDAGCCGMAGSFGFEAEHYELSMRIGGMRLFPAVRQEPAATLIAATGVSCRQQIAHGTGRPARHPVQLVREALSE